MELNQILPAAMIIGVAIIGVSILAQVIGQVKGTQTSGSAEYNLTGQGLTAIAQFGSWWTVMIVVVIAVIVIGLVLMLARGRGG